MTNPLLARLSLGASLTDEDAGRVNLLMSRPITVARRTDLVLRGERSDRIRVVLSGMACRYKLTADGRRAIVGILLPGDFCDLHAVFLGRMDHSIATLPECRIAEIPHQEISAILSGSPTLARAFWWATVVEESILREWLLCAARRRADVHMAHFFCEVHARLAALNLIEEGAFDLPLTQEELADVLGLAAVHANRVLQGLRNAQLVHFDRGRVTVFDLPGLRDYAQFDPDYLHLEGVDQREQQARHGRSANA